MSKGRCKWCNKSIIRGKFCGEYNHKGLYKKFREGFRAEMINIQLKPKPKGSDKYRRIRNQLLNEY